MEQGKARLFQVLSCRTELKKEDRIVPPGLRDFEFEVHGPTNSGPFTLNRLTKNYLKPKSSCMLFLTFLLTKLRQMLFSCFSLKKSKLCLKIKKKKKKKKASIFYCTRLVTLVVTRVTSVGSRVQ